MGGRRVTTVALPLCVAYTVGSYLGWWSPLIARIMGDFGLAAAAGIAAVSCLLHAWRNSGRARAAWTLFGLSAMSTAVGNAVWGWYEVVLGRPVPSPSFADAIFMFFAPLVIAGLAVLSTRGLAAWLRTLLDGWLVAGSLFVLAWTFILRDSMRADTVQTVLVLAYPILDTLLIGMLLAAKLRIPVANRRGTNVALLGFAVTVVSDALWTIPQLRDTYHSGELLDAGWFAGSVILACAPWAAGDTRAVRPQRRAVTLLGVLSPYLVAGASATGLVTGMVIDGHGLDRVGVIAGASVIAALVVRQAVTLVDNVALTRELAVSEERYRSLVQGSSDVIMIAGLDGALRYISPAVTRVYGYQPGDLVGTGLRLLIHPDDVESMQGEVDRLLSWAKSTGRIECRIRAVDGTWLHTESSVSRHGDGLIFNARDVSDRVALQEQLTHFAFHDTLTGLPNRALFADRICHALQQRGNRSEPLAVLFLDLDGFKAVNDSAGHAAGDELLVQAAKRLRGAVRAGDTVARFGGDEFAALLEGDTGPEATRDVAERLLAALSEPYPVGGSDAVVAASIGIAFAGPGTSPEELMRNADLAMYRAKAAGKGRIEVYAPEMHADVVRRVQMESRLRRALDQRRFMLTYQPVMDLATGAVADAQVMVRWRSEAGSPVTPAEFIRLAQDSGRIVPLARWVVEEALRQAMIWHRAGHPIGVAVNLSARQMTIPGLAEAIQAALAEAGAPPGSLMLEISDGAVPDDAEATVERLGDLKAMGTRLAIDDFGVGYAALSCLLRLPVDYLKIGHSFVHDLGRRPDAAVLTSSIVRLGADLGLTLIAEGIERPEQARMLQEMGCHRGRGRLFSGPLDPAGMRTLLTQNAARLYEELPSPLSAHNRLNG